MNIMRILNRIFLIVSLCLLAAILAMGIWSGYTDYPGYCPGIGDPYECTQRQFIQFQIFIFFLMFSPWLKGVLGAWLLANLGNWLLKKSHFIRGT